MSCCADAYFRDDFEKVASNYNAIAAQLAEWDNAAAADGGGR